MAQRALRFGIHDAAGRRAATWKLWTETSGGKADVYLACRRLGGVLKTSLHESGRWHVAHSHEVFEKYVDGANPNVSDRFIEKWQRPLEIALGVTLALRIVTPSSAVTTDIDPSQTNGVIWIPKAPDAKATDIYIFLVKSTTVVSGWPGKRGMGTSLVGAIPLASGETVWVVHRVIPMPDLSYINNKGTARFYKGKSQKDLETGSLRAMAFGCESDGSRVIYDFAVQGRRR